MPRPAKQQFPAVKYSQTQLGGGVSAQGVSYPGGLDLTTPSLRLQPGVLRDCLNIECAQSGGYARVEGYERLDGRASPSSAVYSIVQLAAFVNVPTVGQVATQAVTGATGTIIAAMPGTPPYIGVANITGIFDQVSAVTTSGALLVGVAASLTASLDAKTAAIYTAAAADVQRALIGPVPGSGALLGVVGMVFAGVDQTYGFRANVGNTAVAIYRATPAGWVLVPYFELVSFTAGGSDVPLDGDTLTQRGVTATVQRVMWQSGAWTGSAVGQFVITAPVGGNFAAGAATTSAGATVTLSGAQTPITMVPGGRFQFVKCNFSGQLVTRRIYGCDGINQCFEFDGVTLAPITTGLSPDAPSHIYYHNNYLIIAQASSLLGCGAGTPFKWSPIDGAWEIATGDQVNDMITLPGSQTTATLAVFLRGNTAFLYGTDPTTFNFVTFNTGVGALPYSAQNLFDSFFLDALGAVTLKTTLNWGNFLPTTLTKNLLPFIVQERTKLTASAINRSKSQFRLFFSDGYALWVTMINQQYLGSAPILYPNPVFCCDETVLANGTEVTYAGSSDGLGYVYQLDVGTSFDGAAIDWYIVTAWDPINSPRVIKRFRASSLEIQGGGYAEFSYRWQIGYGNPQDEQAPPATIVLGLSGIPKWDSMVWDSFVWDGVNLVPSDIDVTGSAENIQITISGSANYSEAFTLNSIIHHYSMRRGLRV